jgi:ribosomal protein S18 acetylase RimI-like enzyme
MQIAIRPVRLTEIAALKRRFKVATHQSFAYINEGQRHAIIQQNNLPRLAAACLRSDRILIGAYSGKQLVGYAIGSAEGATAELYWLYVDPNFRGGNVGLKLLSAALRMAEARQVQQMVLATHSHARYYQRQGFELVEERELHGVPMSIMRIKL